MCRRISLSETSTLLPNRTHSGHNLNNLPVTVHMIFDFVQLTRKLLSLDRKGKARELQSYLVARYRSSKKSDLKRKEKNCKMLPQTLQNAFLKIVLPRKHKSTYTRRYFCQMFENPYTEPPKVDGNTALTLIFVVCRVVHNVQSTWIPILRLMF
jgi:hypothetical protein